MIAAEIAHTKDLSQLSVCLDADIFECTQRGIGANNSELMILK